MIILLFPLCRRYTPFEVVPFVLFILSKQVCLPMSGSFETEVCVSGSRSPPISGVNHKTVITGTLWPFHRGWVLLIKWAIELRVMIM